jgi:integrase
MSKNRGDGDGSIFKDGRGRWVAVASLGSKVIDGKRRRVRKKFVGVSRKEVQAKLTQALNNLDRGLAVADSRSMFGVFFTQWLASAKARLKPSSHASYQWLGKKYIMPALANVRLCQLDAGTLNAFMARMLEDGLSPRTVQYAHAVIRSALATAEKQDLVRRNVARLADVPPQVNSNVKPLEPHQAVALLAAVKGHRLEALYSVALAVGLRRGEALGLARPDIDLDDATLTVRRTLNRVKAEGERGALVFSSPKTKGSRRTIPLPDFAVRALRQHLECQDRERRLMGEDWKGARDADGSSLDLVFTTTIGTPIEPRNLLGHLKPTLAALNIPHHRWHDLRHTAASLLIANGASLHDVKEILGQSQIRLTADLYGHLYMSAARKVVAGMDAALSPVAPRVAPQTMSEAVH